MSTAVPVWFVDRTHLRGPTRAIAVIRPALNGGTSAWAMLVHWHPAEGERPIYRYTRGHWYKIGTSVFLTELAAKRFLEGEASRVLAAGEPQGSWQPWSLAARSRWERASALHPRSVYTRSSQK